MSASPDHAELNEELNAYLDGELDATTRRAVERHLEACTACRLELDQLRLTRAAVAALPELRAPRPFTITAPVPAPAPHPAAFPARASGITAWLGWIWRGGSLAAATCALLAVLITGNGSTGALSTKSDFQAEPAPSLSVADRDAAQRVAPVNTPALPSPDRAVTAPAPAAARQGDAPAAASGAGASQASDSLGSTAAGAAAETRAAPPLRPPLASRQAAPAGHAPGRVILAVLAGAFAVASVAAFAVERRLRARHA